VLLAGMAVSLAPHPAFAAGRVDLATVVLGQLEGYKPAAAGVGLAGPLTADQLAQFAPDTKLRTRLADGRTYARTFVRTGGRQAVIVAFDLETVAAARSFQAGARETAGDLGTVTPIAGIANGFHVAVRPEKASNTSTQEVFLQSGSLAFTMVLSDKTTAPVTDAYATQLAQAQAAAVPAAVAAETDSAAGVAHDVGYAIGFLLPIVLVVGLIVWLRRRRKR
jgi:hypothetical protein